MLLRVKGSNLEIAGKINHILPVMLDWGVKDLKSFNFALDFAEQIIIATETLNNWEDLERIFKRFPKQRIIVSVDIKDGQILGKNLSFTFDEINSKIEKLKPQEIILLNISGVGTLKGFNQDIFRLFDGWEDSLILGGGITPEEIKNLNRKGLNKFLIGTVLHSGKIDLNTLCKTSET